MSRFIDEYMHACVPGYPVFASPRWSTEIIVVDSGSEQVEQHWAHPLHRYTLPEAVRNFDVFNAIRDHWLVMRGPAHTWPFRDPLDYASVALEKPNHTPTVSPFDQALGIGDGATQKFQLRKIYTRGSQQYTRTITLPITSTIRIGGDPTGTPPPAEIVGGFSVERETGIVTFDVAPAFGTVLTWGGLFDVPVRFESDDSFDGIVQTFGVGGFADITLLEVRPCQ
jgi:uncharacterized protein (TIGR02217 family)